jgi:hypothetical protein
MPCRTSRFHHRPLGTGDRALTMTICVKDGLIPVDILLGARRCGWIRDLSTVTGCGRYSGEPSPWMRLGAAVAWGGVGKKTGQGHRSCDERLGLEDEIVSAPGRWSSHGRSGLGHVSPFRGVQSTPLVCIRRIRSDLGQNASLPLDSDLAILVTYRLTRCQI